MKEDADQQMKWIRGPAYQKRTSAVWTTTGGRIQREDGVSGKQRIEVLRMKNSLNQIKNTEEVTNGLD